MVGLEAAQRRYDRQDGITERAPSGWTCIDADDFYRDTEVAYRGPRIGETDKAILQELADSGRYGKGASAAIASFWECAVLGITDGVEKIGGDTVYTFLISAVDVQTFPELLGVRKVVMWRDETTQEIKHERH